MKITRNNVINVLPLLSTDCKKFYNDNEMIVNIIDGKLEFEKGEIFIEKNDIEKIIELVEKFIDKNAKAIFTVFIESIYNLELTLRSTRWL